MGAFAQADQFQQFPRAFPCLHMGNTGNFHGKAHICLGTALHEQVELLEDHAHGAAGPVQFGGGQPAHVLSVENDRSFRGALQQIDAAYQRAFARAAHADDAEDIALFHGQVDIPERDHGAVLAFERLAQPLYFNDGFRHASLHIPPAQGWPGGTA